MFGGKQNWNKNSDYCTSKMGRDPSMNDGKYTSNIYFFCELLIIQANSKKNGEGSRMIKRKV
jgi:hypothetical protein